MIYTITLNPAIDYIAEIDKLNINNINRIKSEKILAGGKGINVSIVLKNLGIESVAIGFVSGFTGEEIKRQVEKLDLKTDFVKIENQFSRINVKLQEEKNGIIIGETAINGDGPKVSQEKVEELLNKIEKIDKRDIVVLAGSISKNLPENIYEKICKIVKEKNANIIIDATGMLLVNVLKYNPFLIKPNKYELEEIFNTKISTEKEIIEYAIKLQDMGAKNVLISMDEDGAMLLTQEKNIIVKKAPKGKLVNSVGAGDSMVAGFITGYLTYDDYEEALKMGVAAGSASAFSSKLATKQEVLNIFKNI